MESKQIFRLAGTDVILQDYQPGQGKIILSNDDYDYNLSYYWGSMGKGFDLSKFILNTDDGYLINKLGKISSDGPINIKKTMAKVRQCIKEETDWRFYYSPEADKDLRNELNEIQKYTHDARDFVERMTRIDLFYSGSDDVYSRGEEAFTSMVSAITSEPWYFIVNDEPQVNIWLSKFLPKLREFLKKGGVSMNRIALTEQQAEEMYYQINMYYLFLQCAENVDKTMFGRLKFWNPTMNNHLRKARESTATLLKDFNRHFSPKDSDTVQYEASAELYRAMEFLSRKSPEIISQIMDELEASERGATTQLEHLTAS